MGVGGTLGRLAALASAALLLGASSPTSLQEVLEAPLQSADPAHPIEVIAAGWWIATDHTSKEFTEAIDPDRRIARDRSVPLGSFEVAGDKGPVTLVVDYGAQMKSLTGAFGAIQIGIECMNQPMQCAIPADKTVLVFHADLMAKVPVKLADGSAIFAIGRESHHYRFPPGESVRVDLALGKTDDLEPLLVKAWLIYGENSRDVVPGQTSKASAIRWVLIGGAVVLVLLMRRLLRR